MSEWVPITRDLCSKCYYYRYAAGGNNQGSGSCDYIGIEGHSRIFENGRRKEPTLHHMCDSFTPIASRQETENPWKREGIDKWKRRQQDILIALDVEDD